MYLRILYEFLQLIAINSADRQIPETVGFPYVFYSTNNCFHVCKKFTILQQLTRYP